MLDHATIDKIAARAAETNLASAVERVMSESATDSQGQDALRITIVLKPGTVATLSGDQTLDTLVEIQRALQRKGDDRFAFVEYATETELADPRP